MCDKSGCSLHNSICGQFIFISWAGELWGPRPVIARLYQGNLHNYWNLNCNEDTKTGPSPGPGSVLIQQSSRRHNISPVLMEIVRIKPRDWLTAGPGKEGRVNKNTRGSLLMNIMHNEDI